MKIKIIKSPGFHDTGYFPPLGLSTLYSYLKEKGFDITQEDLNIINHPPANTILKQKNREILVRILSNNERIIRYLKGEEDNELENITRKYIKGTKFEGIDILLISIFPYDFCSFIIALLIAKYFKFENNNKLVIMGGENNQKPYLYESFEIYNSLGIVDYYILGFGEKPLYALLKKIEGEKILLKDIPGLCYRQDGKVRKNRFADQVLTVPNFEGLPLECYKWKPNRFFTKAIRKKFLNTNILILPFQIIYGCPYCCAFCGSSLDPRVYYFQPHEAAEILKRLSEQYKTKYFFFLDNTLNISSEFINNFCDEIINNGLEIYWSDCVSIHNIDNPEILFKMRKAGACRLVFGLETASPRLLRYINKGVTPEQASRVFRWSHEAGIWTAVEIIAGLPREKDEDIDKTIGFLNANIEYIDEIWLTKFVLVTSSSMYRYQQHYGICNTRECKNNLQMIKENKEDLRYFFDEIEGSKWDEKNRQIDYSYNIIDRLRKYKLRQPLETPAHLNLLFYLYTYLSEKREIRYHYNKQQHISYLKNVFQPSTFSLRVLSSLKDGTFITKLKKFSYILTHNNIERH